MENWQENFIKKTSVSLTDGGDTHIHPIDYGNLTVTTRMPKSDGVPSVTIHDNFTCNNGSIKLDSSRY